MQLEISKARRKRKENGSAETTTTAVLPLIARLIITFVAAAAAQRLFRRIPARCATTCKTAGGPRACRAENKAAHSKMCAAGEAAGCQEWEIRAVFTFLARASNQHS